MEEHAVKKLKNKLLETKSSILSIAHDPNKLHAEKTADEVDAANHYLSQTLETKLIARNTFYLKKIDYALKKIEEGTYGECEICGDDISVKRLEARPTASLCLYCKEIEEKKEKAAMQKASGISDWEPE